MSLMRSEILEILSLFSTFPSESMVRQTSRSFISNNQPKISTLSVSSFITDWVFFSNSSYCFFSCLIFQPRLVLTISVLILLCEKFILEKDYMLVGFPFCSLLYYPYLMINNFSFSGLVSKVIFQIEWLLDSYLYTSLLYLSSQNLSFYSFRFTFNSIFPQLCLGSSYSNPLLMVWSSCDQAYEQLLEFSVICFLIWIKKSLKFTMRLDPLFGSFSSSTCIRLFLLESLSSVPRQQLLLRCLDVSSPSPYFILYTRLLLLKR